MYIHKNIFSKSLKYIFGKKISQINNINFTLYFIAKTFLYLQSQISMNLSNMLLEFILPILVQNMYRLWTKQHSFYGIRTCKRFMLYKYAKEFFEEDGIRSPNNLDIYKRFFEKEIPLKLEGNDKLKNCFASRLLDKKPIFEKIFQTTEVKPKPEIKKEKEPESNINKYQKDEIIKKDDLKEEKDINKKEKKSQVLKGKKRTKSFMKKSKKENIIKQEIISNKNILKTGKSQNKNKKSVKEVKKENKEEKLVNIKQIKEEKIENKNVIIERKDDKPSVKTEIKEEKNEQININPVVEQKNEKSMDKIIKKDEKVQVQDNDKIKEHDELF